MHRQTAQYEPLLFTAKHMNQSKNNVASINQKPIHIAPDFFWLVCLDSLYGWFLYSENFHSSQYTSHPVILREAEGEVAESTSLN